jgi:hypothetical protein
LSFERALGALNELKRDEVVSDYAIAGALTLLFWSEPVATYDLDVLVFLPEASGLLYLRSNAASARRRSANQANRQRVVARP